MNTTRTIIRKTKRDSLVSQYTRLCKEFGIDPTAQLVTRGTKIELWRECRYITSLIVRRLATR